MQQPKGGVAVAKLSEHPSAGGGKSLTCLMKALKYINDPAARVMIVRRSYPMLKLSGGLWDESQHIYKHFGGVAKVQRLTWEFPNGATIQFAAIPDDLSEWQGSQITHFLVDEAAEFKQEEVLFLMSRLRSAKFKGHMNLTLTCNPSRDSFLYEWVKFSLDDEGVPVVGTENRKRWFVNISGKVFWADSIDELWNEVGDKYYLNRDPEKGVVTFQPKSFKFIPLTVVDNPVLLRNNPGYLANLLSQSRVNQLRFYKGSWTARPDGAGIFRREWVTKIQRKDLPTNRTQVRSWDLAATVPSEVTPDPDYTAGVKLSRDKFGIYYIEDCYRFRKLTDGVLREIVKTAFDDGLDECSVTIPRDAGAGGKTANAFFIRTLAEEGIAAKSVVMSGHSSKVSRFIPFCSLAESGQVRMVEADWNEDYLAELEHFDGDRNKHDDMVDATSDAFNTLSKQIQLPTFSLPSLQQRSPVPSI